MTPPKSLELSGGLTIDQVPEPIIEFVKWLDAYLEDRGITEVETMGQVAAIHIEAANRGLKIDMDGTIHVRTH